jgi:hypothetical protein
MGQVAYMRGKGNLYRVSAGRLEGRSRCRWKNNFKIYIQEIKGYFGTVSASG